MVLSSPRCPKRWMRGAAWRAWRASTRSDMALQVGVLDEVVAAPCSAGRRLCGDRALSAGSGRRGHPGAWLLAQPTAAVGLLLDGAGCAAGGAGGCRSGMVCALARAAGPHTEWWRGYWRHGVWASRRPSRGRRGGGELAFSNEAWGGAYAHFAAALRPTGDGKSRGLRYE